MTSQIYLPARQRHCDVLRLVASGCTRVKGIKARLPGESYTAIHTSLTFLRNQKYIKSSGTANGGNPAEYTLIADNLDKAIDEIMPHTATVDTTELDRAMGMPASVRQVLDGQHGVRVVVGRAGLNVTETAQERLQS